MKIKKIRNLMLEALNSSSNKDHIDLKIDLLAFLFILFCSIIFYFLEPNITLCQECDSTLYVAIADDYFLKGHYLRTYVYPLFLYVLSGISKITGIENLIIISIGQLLLYFFSIKCFGKSISLINKNISKIIYLAFTLNIFVLPYIVISLTDLLMLCFFMLWLSRLVLLEYYLTNKNFDRARTQIWFMAILSGVMLVTRPSGVLMCLLLIVIISIYYSQLYCLYANSKDPISHTIVGKLNPYLLGHTVPLIIIFFVLPLAPQIYLNYVYFNSISPFPTYNLGKFQIEAGILYIKYGTHFDGFKGIGIVYSNPFYNKLQGNTDIFWYFRNLSSSIPYVFCKLVGAFDFDYITPYVYNLRSRFSWLTGFISLSIFSIGTMGTLSYAIFDPKFLGHRFFPLICFFMWSLFTLPTALELRFSLPMLVMFIVMSIYQIQLYFLLNKPQKMYIICAYIASLSVFIPIAYFVRSTVI